MNRGGTIKIYWEKVSLSDLSNIEDAYFYAIFRGRNLLYIGIAYHQNVSNEIRQTLNRFSEDRRGLYLCLGYIDKEETTYGRITQQIIKDVECALINALQPPYNTQCTNSYTGRSGLEIYNRGCIRGKIKTLKHG